MRINAIATNVSEDKTEEISLIFTNKKLGEGASGEILEAKLAATTGKVAVKEVDFERRGETNEVDFLKNLRHCNIVKMLYHFREDYYPRKQQYIVMECMPGSLWDIHYNKHTLVDRDIPTYVLQWFNRGRNIPKLEIKLYTYQLLRSLAYIHNQGICHRDVKPENILIDPNTCVLKMCDFGMAKDLSILEANSTGVCTINYRSPELLLGYTNYTNSIDTWSVGCVLVELLKGGRMLFTPAAAYPFHQLTAVMEVLGSPTQAKFKGMKPWCHIEGLIKKEAKAWSEIVSPYPISDDVISLCSQLLCYSPNSRIPPHKALAHKFFDELRLPGTKFLSNGNSLPPLFNFEPGEFPGDFDHLIPSHTYTAI